jgi:hypothetical protein
MIYIDTVPSKAVLQLTRIIGSFVPQRPGCHLRSGHVGFMAENVHWGRFYPSTSVSSQILIPPPAPYSLVILSPTLYRLDTESVVK